MPRNKLFSTTSYNPPFFKPHGVIESRVEGNLFVQEGSGPFNKEILLAMNAVHAEAKKLLPPAGPWYALFIFDISALAPREMLEELRQYLTIQVTQNLASQATALVLPRSVEAATLMKPIYLRVWREAGIPCEAFENVAEAKAWLHALGKKKQL